MSFALIMLFLSLLANLRPVLAGKVESQAAGKPKDSAML